MRIVFVSMGFALCLLLQACVCPCGNQATGAPAGEQVADGQAGTATVTPPPDIDVAPPTGPADTIGPNENFVMVKAVHYGTSGGIFIQVDVSDPENDLPFTNTADIQVWTGLGTAPATAPTDPAQLVSRPNTDLNPPDRWAGGTVVADFQTSGWIFIEVRLRREGLGSVPLYFNKTFPASEIGNSWVAATKLN